MRQLGRDKTIKKTTTRPVYIKKTSTCDESDQSGRIGKSWRATQLIYARNGGTPSSFHHPHHQTKGIRFKTRSGGNGFICRAIRSLATPATAGASWKPTFSMAPTNVVGHKPHLSIFHWTATAARAEFVSLRHDIKNAPATVI